ncbi:MAG TPA: hypothetical protein PKK45_18060 [Leptospiraceae bacterium]|nr:hypothetical protein [Leptospiraceae bacterium]HNN60727.1 hypothetical protein [Leptospiraceae bacterium]
MSPGAFAFIFSIFSAAGLGAQAFEGRLAVGSFHNCAIVENGKVVCWGLGDTGQIGDGKLVNALTPRFVSGITNAKSLAAGEHWTCALLADSSVKCWGFIAAPWAPASEKSKTRPCAWGSHTDPCTPVPVSVPPAQGITSIMGMATMTYGILPDGKIVVWTGNDGTANLLKDGKNIQLSGRSSMVIDWIPDAKEVATIYVSTGDMPSHMCAVTKKGRIYCHGATPAVYGPRKPICTAEPRIKPVCQIDFQGEKISVTGEDAPRMCKYAASLDPQMMKSYEWYCQGQTCTYREVPLQKATHLWYLIMANGKEIKSHVTGYAEIFKSTEAEKSKCRDDFYTVELDATPMEGLTDVRRVSLYSDSSAFGITNKDEVYYWGSGREDRDILPDVVPESSGKPIPPVKIPQFTGAISIRHMSWNGCALFKTGIVKCWGVAGDEGRLGNGIFGDENNETTRTPVQVKGIRDAVYHGMGHSHSCVAVKDGRVFCWGLNDSGQLGNGQTKNSAEPVEVKGVVLNFQ